MKRITKKKEKRIQENWQWRKQRMPREKSTEEYYEES